MPSTMLELLGITARAGEQLQRLHARTLMHAVGTACTNTLSALRMLQSH